MYIGFCSLSPTGPKCLGPLTHALLFQRNKGRSSECHTAGKDFTLPVGSYQKVVSGFHLLVSFEIYRGAHQVAMPWNLGTFH